MNVLQSAGRFLFEAADGAKKTAPVEGG